MSARRETILRALRIASGDTPLDYSPWRHGGWYTNLQYPDGLGVVSGASGCVAKVGPNKWQIACDHRAVKPTFRSRDEAARAEAALAVLTALELAP